MNKTKQITPSIHPNPGIPASPDPLLLVKLVSPLPAKEDALLVVSATGPGNPPAVQVRTRKTVWFGSRTDQKPDPLLLGGPNPAPYLSTPGFAGFR